MTDFRGIRFTLVPRGHCIESAKRPHGYGREGASRDKKRPVEAMAEQKPRAGDGVVQRRDIFAGDGVVEPDLRVRPRLAEGFEERPHRLGASRPGRRTGRRRASRSLPGRSARPRCRGPPSRARASRRGRGGREQVAVGRHPGEQSHRLRADETGAPRVGAVEPPEKTAPACCPPAPARNPNRRRRRAQATPATPSAELGFGKGRSSVMQGVPWTTSGVAPATIRSDSVTVIGAAGIPLVVGGASRC
jgi:hypothetical protein